MSDGAIDKASTCQKVHRSKQLRLQTLIFCMDDPFLSTACLEELDFCLWVTSHLNSWVQCMKTKWLETICWMKKEQDAVQHKWASQCLTATLKAFWIKKWSLFLNTLSCHIVKQISLLWLLVSWKHISSKAFQLHTAVSLNPKQHSKIKESNIWKWNHWF